MKEDFYKSIKENLENRQEPSFREEAWEAMEQQLIEAEQLETTSVWTGRLALPLLLLLLGMAGSNFWFYQQLHKVKNNLLYVQTDTIYKSQVIIQTDTIYQTKLIEEIVTVNTNILSPPSVENQGISNFQNISDKISSSINGTDIQNHITYFNKQFQQQATQYSIASPYWKNRSTINPISSNNWNVLNGVISNSLITNTKPIEEETIVYNDLNSSTFPVIHLPLLSQPFFTSNLNNTPIDIELPFVKQQKTLQQRMYQIRPKTFHLGLLGGVAITDHKDLEHKGGYTFGLNATIGFTSNFRLWSEASFTELEYSSIIIDPALGIPSIDLPKDNFVFQFAEVNQPAYQFGAGFQYLLNARKKWKPYVGIGYGVVALVPYEVAYEFTDLNSNVDLILEQDVKRKKLLKDHIMLKTGLEYDFTKRWAFQLDGMYRKGNENMGLSSPNVWSVRSGLIYKF